MSASAFMVRLGIMTLEAVCITVFMYVLPSCMMMMVTMMMILFYRYSSNGDRRNIQGLSEEGRHCHHPHQPECKHVVHWMQNAPYMFIPCLDVFFCLYQCMYNISKVPDQNGISRLYIMLEIYYSGPEPSVYEY